MNIEIKKITLKGFKKYKEETAFEFGKRTEILGDNAEGKSSISEAIAWCFTGCDITGSERVTRLINNDKPKLTEVAIDFTKDGEPQKLVRRKKGSTTEVFLNDYKTSPADVAREFYQAKDVFLSIFNPYFFPALEPKEAKKLLGDILKPVAKEDVFKSIGDFHRDKLLKNGFDIPELFLADKRADLKEQEENIIYLEGKLDGLKLQEVPAKKDFDYADLKKVSDRLKEINDGNKQPEEFTALVEQKERLEREIDSGYTEVRALESVWELKAEKDLMLNRYKSLKQQLDLMTGNIIICPKCGHEIGADPQKKESLIKDIEETKKNGIRLKKQIEESEARNKEIEADQAKKADLWLTGKKADLIQLLDRIESLLEKEVEKNKKIKEEVEVLAAKERELEKEKIETERSNMLADMIVEQNEKTLKEIEITKKQVKNGKAKITELKAAITAGKEFNSAKLNIQSEMISQYLDKVELQFQKITKDGELKEDFKILYEGREFNYLSNAEKIKAGLEIGNFISNMMNLHLPVFVDNAESITAIKDIDTQIILAKVVARQELKVEVI